MLSTEPIHQLNKLVVKYHFLLRPFLLPDVDLPMVLLTNLFVLVLLVQDAAHEPECSHVEHFCETS